MPDPTPDARGTEAEPVAWLVWEPVGSFALTAKEADSLDRLGAEPLFTQRQLDAAVSRAVREALEEQAADIESWADIFSDYDMQRAVESTAERIRNRAATRP